MTKSTLLEEPPFRITPVVVQVLLSLSEGKAHAYGIMKDIRERTKGRFNVGPGSLHFTLVKLQGAAMIEPATPEDPASDDARRKYYRIVDRGRRVLQEELAIMADTVELARSRNLLIDRGSA